MLTPVGEVKVKSTTNNETRRAEVSGQSLRESGYTLTRVNLAPFQPCVAHVVRANYSVGQLVTLAEAFSYV